MTETDELIESEQEAEEPPKELDPETRARRDAALRHVRKLGDPVLRSTSLPVERFDDVLKQEIERMGELMGDALGVGLAATQLGVLHRVFVYRAYPEDPLTAVVNPVLEWKSDELETAEEGCLSLPGVHVEVERPAQVRVSAQDDRRAAAARSRPRVFEARVIQHETDHLNGVARFSHPHLGAARCARQGDGAAQSRYERRHGARRAPSRTRVSPSGGSSDAHLAHRLPRHFRICGRRARAVGRERSSSSAGAESPRPASGPGATGGLSTGRRAAQTRCESLWSSRRV